VQPLSSGAQVRPGHQARFAVWVWSTKATSKSVSVSVRIGSARHVKAAHFTVCPGSSSSVCGIGTLPTGQADELQATAFVQGSAVNGEQVQLTATASGKSAHSFGSSGSVQVSKPASPTPTPTTSFPPVSTTLPPVTLPPVGGTDPVGLFPTVSPDPSSSATNLGFPPAKKATRARAETAAAVVPLDPRLIGGQLAGLAVLAGGIAIAIARLSLRRPKPQDGPGKQDPGQ
jgi:hypothetical protein